MTKEKFGLKQSAINKVLDNCLPVGENRQSVPEDLGK